MRLFERLNDILIKILTTVVGIIVMGSIGFGAWSFNHWGEKNIDKVVYGLLAITIILISIIAKRRPARASLLASGCATKISLIALLAAWFEFRMIDAVR